MLKKSTYALVISIIFGIAFYVLNLHLDGNIIWTGKLGNGGLYAEYCELNQFEKFLRQPMNSYSNLAFLFFGMLIIQYGFSDYKSKINGNALQAFPLYSILQGAYFCYLFVGSSFYHASLTWIGQRVDMNATYGLTLGLLAYVSYRNLSPYCKNLKKLQIYVIVLLLTLTAIFSYLHLMISSSYLLPFLFLIICIQIIYLLQKNKNRFQNRYVLLSFISIVFALIIRTLDVEKIGCDPLSIFQGHALWHFFTGLGAYSMYQFYRSERANQY